MLYVCQVAKYLHKIIFLRHYIFQLKTCCSLAFLLQEIPAESAHTDDRVNQDSLTAFSHTGLGLHASIPQAHSPQGDSKGNECH